MSEEKNLVDVESNEQVLEFGCSFRGFKIKTKSIIRDKETKQATKGDAIVFEASVCRLRVKSDFDKIKILVNHRYFENGKPGAVHMWPMDVDAYNKFAKEKGLVLVPRKGSRKVSLTGQNKETIAAIAQLEMEKKVLQDELEALQNSVTTSNKKVK
jgi:hypothetical protein